MLPRITMLGTPASGPGVWTQRTTSGSRSWSSIASSYDGKRLTACVRDGYIYTSSDYGATWKERTAAGSRYWCSISSSSDGSVIVAGANSKYLYVSKDYGETWEEKTTSQNSTGYWASIAVSSNAEKIIACYYSASSDNCVYISNDAGEIWINQTALVNAGIWRGVASSSDGSKLFVCSRSGYIYYSHDAGSTWIKSIGAYFFEKISCDGTGAVVVACADTTNGVVLLSKNGGVSWETITPSGSHDWYGIDVSGIGDQILSCASSSYMQRTKNNGASWSEETSAGSRVWFGVKFSYSGKRAVACAYNGYIYTYY